MPAYRLHTHPISHWCVSAERMLSFKGLAFERVYVPYHDHVPLLQRSGQDYIPWVEVVEDGAEAAEGGSGVLWHRIPDWLEATHPEPTLYPDGTRGLARAIEDWAHAVVEEAVWKYVVADAVETFRDPVERWVFVEMQERKRGPLELMRARKDEFLEEVRRVGGLAEDILGDRPFLLGERPSLADFGLYGALAPLAHTGNRLPKELARLRAWQDRVGKLP